MADIASIRFAQRLKLRQVPEETGLYLTTNRLPYRGWFTDVIKVQDRQPAGKAEWLDSARDRRVSGEVIRTKKGHFEFLSGSSLEKYYHPEKFNWLRRLFIP